MSSNVMTDKREILVKLQRDGWRVERTRGAHIRCLSPCGEHIVVTSGTDSDFRGTRNFLRDLEHAGWKGGRR